MTAPTWAEPAPATGRRRPPKPRPSPAARRVGYAFVVLFQVVFLWLLHIWPGWEAVPFLTADFRELLWLIDLSLWAGLAVNLVYLIRDPEWLTALGAIATSAISTVVSVRTWQVFPFDVSDVWAVLFRIAVALGVVGSIIGILVNVRAFARAVTTGGADRTG